MQVNSPNLTKINLLGLDKKAMEDFFVSIGEKPYRAQQVLKWIHFNGAQDFQSMSNISKILRQKLSDLAEIRLPQVLLEQPSTDGTFKWLLRLDDGILKLFIAKNRGTYVFLLQLVAHSIVIFVPLAAGFQS